ncbi:MAG: 4-alpha-glucanotransferase [Treponema sp.]|nr:4-alpha-glucanotransferase [Treponema sp.]
MKERAAGILLAVSSLPSPYGIGSFGEDARQWLRFLKAAGQKYWQILPLGPTGWGDSPYQSFSAFALSSYYIDLDTLVDNGLLTKDEVSAAKWGKRADKVDYAALFRRREPLLRLAAGRFAGADRSFEEFCSHNKFWLEDYSLFMAIKKKMRGCPWLEWKKQLKLHNAVALDNYKNLFAADIFYHSFVQYTAYTQWKAIRSCAGSLGLSIIGDMPIYVAADSADTWANGSLFQLDEERRPLHVAGCPPDPFSASGQLWGNPLYNWELMAQTGYSWWISRLRLSLELYDVIRIDHFRGLESYYSIDAAAHDASAGRWIKGPGINFIDAVNRELPAAQIIAEDLGYLTPEVKALVKDSGYPGMKILQFAFDSRESSDYMPYTYERNCVVYTGTHDNTTCRGWFKSAQSEDAARAMQFFGIKNIGEGSQAFIRCALASAANTAIIPMQDYLDLDDRARMNIPSTLGGGNWRWRMKSGAASAALAGEIRRLTGIYGRETGN